jgi:hypothetical protein
MMTRLWGFAAILLLLSGCASQRMSGQQLERVAKDWCLSIRASQVIPVYPLTEDLQPGDVFLVQTPAEEQVRVYLERGFLPLENLVTRLPLDGYKSFYSAWPTISAADDPPPPRRWQFPESKTGPADFSPAPIAAFPAYNFAVSSSRGLSVAIPVQSLPIGLNLLDSTSANGTITMKDASTYALPAQTIYAALDAWALKNRSYLTQFEPREVDGKPRPFYLRVVNRVYLVKTVDVSLFANRGTGASASAGAPKKVELLDLGNTDKARKDFAAVNELLAAGSAVSDTLPGGTVRVTMATNRSVSMLETFARPLAVGYLAFDYEILPGGKLNAPVSTFLRLSGQSPVPGKPVVPYSGCDASCKALEDWLDADAGNDARLRAWLERRRIGLEPYQIYYGPYPELRQSILTELVKP